MTEWEATGYGLTIGVMRAVWDFANQHTWPTIALIVAWLSSRRINISVAHKEKE